MMENLDLVGIDLAKNVFQLHGCSSTGEVIFRKQVKRNKRFCRKLLGSIRISYALPNDIEQKVNAGGAHGPSRLSGLAI
jgi:hypothetical protein